MITVKFTSALLIYLCCFLIFLLSLGIGAYLKKRRRKAIEPLRALTICEYCQFAYLSLTTHPVSRCPQCLSYNRKAK